MRKESDLGQEAPATGTLARAATPAAARNVLLEVRLLRRCIGDLEILHGIDLAVLAGSGYASSAPAVRARRLSFAA